MKDTLTHISIVMDRSGSMQTVAKEAENAINHFIVDQKNQPDECTLFFIDFDTEAPHRVVYDGGIQDASEYMLDPRGMTPLLDAIDRLIGLAWCHRTVTHCIAHAQRGRPWHGRCNTFKPCYGRAG